MTAIMIWALEAVSLLGLRVWSSFIALSAMGVAALILAIGSALVPSLLPNWSVALLAYAVLAAGCAIVARKIIPKPKGKDINEY